MLMYVDHVDCIHTYIYIYVYIYIHTEMCVYIYRKSADHTPLYIGVVLCTDMHMIYTYIYIHHRNYLNIFTHNYTYISHS